MAHTYANNFIHCVSSTKDRRSVIPAARAAELYTYLGGIARGEGFSLVAYGTSVMCLGDWKRRRPYGTPGILLGYHSPL